ncbi:MAG: glycosyltransferase [Alistipes sp.]|nr:glycosyltransferase [Candidatus Minthomonas equi]
MSDCAARLNRRGICIIIPTLNNAGTICDVVHRSQSYCNDIFVVIDGSTDSTLEELKTLPVKPRVISLPSNTGKGNALREGFKAAAKAGFTYAITLDADGQHFPEDIPLFLEANINNPGALIVGSRKGLSDAERSPGSRFANSFSNFWFFLQTLHPLKDTQSGYRLYPLKKLKFLSFLTSRYEAELELLVLSVWMGVKLVSIDVNVYYPPRGERVSHFKPFRDFTRISILNTFLCVLAVIFGLPLTILRQVWTILKTLVSFLSYIIFVGLIVMPPMSLYLKFGKLTRKKKEKVHKIIFHSNRLARKLLPGIPFIQMNPFNETFEKPAIIICNHQSHLDLVQLLSTTPKLIVLTADYIQNSPLYGYIIKAADFLPVSQGYDSIESKMKQYIAEGYSIAIYPEGTRSRDGSIGRFHQGAFQLADNLGTDIIPMILYGSGKALPKFSCILHSWPIYVEIDKRMSTEDIRSFGCSYREQASGMRTYYRQRYSELSDFCDKNLI